MRIRYKQEMTRLRRTTRRGLRSRAGSSFGGVLVGFILLPLAVWLLFWNEGRSVKRYQALQEGAGAVVSVPTDRMDAAGEGQLVHLTGELVVEGVLVDAEFGVSAQGLRLERRVETYQWVEDVTRETRDRLGGGEETVETFSYRTSWRSGIVDSSRFAVPEGHQNPSSARFAPASFAASDVRLGVFRLPDFITSGLGGAQDLPVGNLDEASEVVREAGRVANGMVYFGSPEAPAVGDTRVAFRVVPAGPVSVIAARQGDTLATYPTQSGVDLHLVSRGIVPAEEMFAGAHAANRALTWGIRVGGFFLLGIGFSMILAPIGVLAGVLPFLGRIVRAGTTAISFLLGGIVWAVVVAVAWILYRPLLGIGILVIAVALLALVIRRIISARAAPDDPPETAPTNPGPSAS